MVVMSFEQFSSLNELRRKFCFEWKFCVIYNT